MITKDYFIHCERLTSNKKFEEVKDYYDNMAVPVPEDEIVEEYTRTPLSFDLTKLDQFYIDSNHMDFTIIILNDIAHMIDMHYLQLKEILENFEA